MERMLESFLVAVLIVSVAVILGIVQLPQWWVDYVVR